MDLSTADLISALNSSPKITSASVSTAPTEQGVYILWLESEPLVCLKVGIAGPRSGKGLRERLRYHFSGNESISVLARHLANDRQSPWVCGYELAEQQERKRFLSVQCYFQAVALPGIDRDKLLKIEDDLIRDLRPRYLGRVETGR